MRLQGISTVRKSGARLFLRSSGLTRLRFRYWEWAKYKDDPESSPLFDGSDYSLSGNGESIPHDDISFVLPRTNITVQIPAGPGGGCIHNGPFKDMKVNLGPTSFSGFLGPAVGSGTGLDYNPRCLKRDINPLFSRERMSYQVITDLLTKTANYDDLVTNIGREGVHPSGHQTVGGLMVDQFASAGDPVFYLHHAGVDRMWAIWQSLKPSERQNQLQGFTTWFNSKFRVGHVTDRTPRGDNVLTFLSVPPSPEIKPEDPIDLWFEAGPKAAVDLTNTVENDFCYYYD
jgi:tyrosinase